MVEHRIALSGEYDLTNREDLARQLTAVLDEQPGLRVVIDLRDVTFIDSQGLAVLIDAHRQASASGGAVRLVNPAPVVQRMLDVTGLAQLFGL